MYLYTCIFIYVYIYIYIYLYIHIYTHRNPNVYLSEVYLSAGWKIAINILKYAKTNLFEMNIHIRIYKATTRTHHAVFELS